MNSDNQTQIEQIRDLTRTLIDAVLKDGPSIQLRLRAEDEALEIAGGQFELRREGKKWLLEVAEFTDDYPHGPSYVDMIETGEYLGVVDTALAIVESLASKFMEYKLDELATDAMAREMAEEDAASVIVTDNDGEAD